MRPISVLLRALRVSVVNLLKAGEPLSGGQACMPGTSLDKPGHETSREMQER
jgi:hypothetical protein